MKIYMVSLLHRATINKAVTRMMTGIGVKIVKSVETVVAVCSSSVMMARL